MKINTRTLGLGLLLLLGWQPHLLRGQEQQNCQDVLILYGGNRLTGQITAVKGGDTLVFRSWGGAIFEISQKTVLKMEQNCRRQRRIRGQGEYHFNEQGWYHHTRIGMLIGQAYYGAENPGLQIQHSSGRMFSKLLGLGLGTGVERFDVAADVSDAVIYPIFAELRGYLQPKNISPYYSLGAGWGFAGKSSGQRWGFQDDWRGGWMAQAEIGYRIGNHFIIHGGLRLQQKYRDWTSNPGWWGAEGERGTDRILHKRFVLGVGLLL